MERTPRRIELLDRSEMIGALNAYLRIDPARTAVVTIDMKRAHLDHEVGTMVVPEEAARSVLAHASKVLEFSRNRGIPVIHVLLENRGVESARLPFQDALVASAQSWVPGGKAHTRRQTLEGTRAAELMPELGPAPGDYLVRSKRRFSAFYGTDLEILLRELQRDIVVLAGINTNTCVLCSAFDAANRDLTTVVLSDCVASAYGEDLHILGLEVVRRCLGWCLTTDEFLAKVE